VRNSAEGGGIRREMRRKSRGRDTEVVVRTSRSSDSDRIRSLDVFLPECLDDLAQ
jgi:DNA-binding response OmpR family regulator